MGDVQMTDKIYPGLFDKIPQHTIMLFVCHPQILHKRIVFSFSWGLKWPQEKLKTMLTQNFGVTNKEHYNMLWHFLQFSIVHVFFVY